MGQRILIYRIGNLGDIICAIPAMVAVRRHFPDSWIGLLTNKELTGNLDATVILKDNDFLDGIVPYYPARVKEVWYLWNLLKKVRSLKIDLLVYLGISRSKPQRLMRDWIFFKMAGCRKTIGFRLLAPIRVHIENGVRIPVFPQEVDRLMSLLASLGIDPNMIEFRLPISEKDKLAVDAIWNGHRLTDMERVVAISPAGKFPVKHWEVRRFAEVARILQRDFNATIVLIGGVDEQAAAEEIVNEVGNSIINLTGKTTCMQSAEIIRRCTLLVANDCGPGHLAAAVGTPVVGIYSSRDFPETWHPWGGIHTILRNDSLPCRFCFRTECKTRKCINSITVEQVVKACERYLVKYR
jgi:ADP-heptose:LPS heptosyltransferase